MHQPFPVGLHAMDVDDIMLREGCEHVEPGQCSAGGIDWDDRDHDVNRGLAAIRLRVSGKIRAGDSCPESSGLARLLVRRQLLRLFVAGGTPEALLQTGTS